jgi:hypothetical protein
MNAFDSNSESAFGRRCGDIPPPPPQNREGLALVMLERIVTAEGGEPEQNTRAYLLDLLREIILTIDGKRTPPITIPTVDRRHG